MTFFISGKQLSNFWDSHQAALKGKDAVVDKLLEEISSLKAEQLGSQTGSSKLEAQLQDVSRQLSEAKASSAETATRVADLEAENQRLQETTSSNDGNKQKVEQDMEKKDRLLASARKALEKALQTVQAQSAELEESRKQIEVLKASPAKSSSHGGKSSKKTPKENVSRTNTAAGRSGSQKADSKQPGKVSSSKVVDEMLEEVQELVKEAEGVKRSVDTALDQAKAKDVANGKAAPRTTSLGLD